MYKVLCAWSTGRYRAFKILSLTRVRKKGSRGRTCLNCTGRVVRWQTGPEEEVRHGSVGGIFSKNGLIGLIKDERVRLFANVYIHIFIYSLIIYGLSPMNTKMLMV